MLKISPTLQRPGQGRGTLEGLSPPSMAISKSDLESLARKARYRMSDDVLQILYSGESLPEKI